MDGQICRAPRHAGAAQTPAFTRIRHQMRLSAVGIATANLTEPKRQAAAPKEPLEFIFDMRRQPEPSTATLPDLLVKRQKVFLDDTIERLFGRLAPLIRRAALLGQLCGGEVIWQAKRGRHAPLSALSGPWLPNGSAGALNKPPPSEKNFSGDRGVVNRRESGSAARTRF